MRKFLYFLFPLLILLTGCIGLPPEEGGQMTYRQQLNPYAQKKVLILSRTTGFKNKLIENITQRLQRVYSFDIDDLGKIYDYNFTDYYKVVVIESAMNNHLDSTDKYLKDYFGVNNLVIVAVTWDQFQPVPGLTVISCQPDENKVQDYASQIIFNIRQ